LSKGKAGEADYYARPLGTYMHRATIGSTDQVTEADDETLLKPFKGKQIVLDREEVSKREVIPGRGEKSLYPAAD